MFIALIKLVFTSLIFASESSKSKTSERLKTLKFIYGDLSKAKIQDLKVACKQEVWVLLTFWTLMPWSGRKQQTTCLQYIHTTFNSFGGSEVMSNVNRSYYSLLIRTENRHFISPSIKTSNKVICSQGQYCWKFIVDLQLKMIGSSVFDCFRINTWCVYCCWITIIMTVTCV